MKIPFADTSLKINNNGISTILTLSIHHFSPMKMAHKSSPAYSMCHPFATHPQFPHTHTLHFTYHMRAQRRYNVIWKIPALVLVFSAPNRIPFERNAINLINSLIKSANAKTRSPTAPQKNTHINIYSRIEPAYMWAADAAPLSGPSYICSFPKTSIWYHYSPMTSIILT